MCEDSVNSMLREQSAWIEIAMKSLKPGKEAPTVTSDWLEQIEKAVKHWLDAKGQAWMTWYAAVKQLDLYCPHGTSRDKAKSHTDKVITAPQQVTRDSLDPNSDYMVAA
jgi:hypothetical protein